MEQKNLPAPPVSREQGAKEVLRVWAKPNETQQVALETTWGDPGAWGLLLADVARHVAKAYSKQGHDEQVALARVLELFHAEMRSPTDEPKPVDAKKAH